MYRQFFGLTERPFTISPNPRYLYMSPRHREALAHLLFGIGDGGGFVVLTGEVGTGKTTLCRRMLEQMPSHINVAYVVNPKISAQELLEIICDKLNIPVPPQRRNIKDLIDLLNTFLLETHKRGMKTVLIIDEAQNLTADVLEQIRLLTNLETDEEKLLQIVLIGQPELQATLQRNDLRQLNQRITARYHLTALNEQEVSDYLKYRLQVAGCSRPLFTPSAEKVIYQLSGGVPRVINLLADRALLGAYARNQAMVKPDLVRQAAKEIFVDKRAPRFWWHKTSSKRVGALLMGVLLLSAGLFLGQKYWLGQPTSVLPSATTYHWLTQAQAVKQLQRRWRMTEPLNCPGRQGRLQCVQDTLNMVHLLSLNLPVAVALTPETQQARWAVLVGVRGASVVLSLDGQSTEMSQDAFANRWTGEAIYLWQTPPGYRQPLRLGMHGADVAWLKKRLMVWSGFSAEQLIVPESSEYDSALKQLVEKFQAAQNLPVDGVAGPLTLIRLAQFSDPDYPRWRTVRTKTEGRDVADS